MTTKTILCAFLCASGKGKIVVFDFEKFVENDQYDLR